MSKSMTIYCEDCRKKYWYGQGRESRRTIYNPEKLADFLGEHQGHKIWTEDDYTEESYDRGMYSKAEPCPLPDDRYEYEDIDKE